MLGVYKNTLGCELLETVRLFGISVLGVRYITQSSFGEAADSSRRRIGLDLKLT
jgi:hypothetical protein